MAHTIAFDARSLQDPQYRNRGIGRTGANLVRSARDCIRSADLRVVGLTDPALPALDDGISRFFDESHTGDFLPEGGEPAWFIALSPMTHDPLFAARICQREDVFKAAIVHQLAPLDDPERYLPTLADKIDYHTKLSWLVRYDHCFPISRHGMSALVRRLAMPASRVSLNAPPIAGAFLTAAATAQAPPALTDHVLALAGADPGENIDCAIAAHANSWTGRTGRTRLLVAGEYPKATQSDLRTLYGREGGTQSQLVFLDRLDDEALVELYRTAICVVAPSRSGGLPAVEAMAVGAPVLASNIPEHRELLGNSDFMFGLEEYSRLASLIDRIATSPDLRNQIIASQKHLWHRFRADDVARTFWSVMEAQARPTVAAPLVGGRRPQIAFLGPLPPDKSGVADYTAATFKALSRHVDIHAFSGQRQTSRLAGTVSLEPMSALPFISHRLDRVVGVMGNSHFHARVFDLLMRFGGACISHDNRLLGFYLRFVGEARTRELARRELGRPLENGELEKWLNDESTLEATFLGELAARCKPFIVHSHVTARIIQQRLGVHPTILPFCIYREWTEDELTPERRTDARRRLGIAPNITTVVAMGYVNNSKAPLDCIAALEMLRAWGIPAELYFVGEIQGDAAPLRRLCDELQVADRVHFASGYVAEADYRNYLLAADVAVQLRTHLLGGLSGALLDCIAAGVPTVVNRDLAEAMEAPSYVLPVADRPHPALIAQALKAAIEFRAGAQSRRDERRAYLDLHNFDVYARGLCQALGLDIARSAAA